MSPRVLSTARPLLHCNLKRVGAGKEMWIFDCRLPIGSRVNRKSSRQEESRENRQSVSLSSRTSGGEGAIQTPRLRADSLPLIGVESRGRPPQLPR
jgi:hypothetical protein